MALKVLLVVGTRPEAIKLAPVYFTFKERGVDVRIVSTGQSKDLLADAFGAFGIRPDYGFECKSGNLEGILAECLEHISYYVINGYQPDWVLVQGDTTSALAGALAAYYNQIKLGHVEAGLTTGDLYAPFPEEGHRRMISEIATLNFAPTFRAAMNVKRAYVTGNTVVDALGLVPKSEIPIRDRYILVTAHRRESLGEPLERICQAVSEIAKGVKVIFSVHPNPAVQETVRFSVNGSKNIELIEPPGYTWWVHHMRHAYLILTDSGGIQEEAPSFGVPVVVMRDKTERQEAVEGGFARLAGTTVEGILEAATGIDEWRDKIKGKPNPFGDGRASERIAERVLNYGK